MSRKVSLLLASFFVVAAMSVKAGKFTHSTKSLVQANKRFQTLEGEDSDTESASSSTDTANPSPSPTSSPKRYQATDKLVAYDARAGTSFGSAIVSDGKSIFVSTAGLSSATTAVYVNDFELLADSANTTSKVWFESSRIAESSGSYPAEVTIKASNKNLFVGLPHSDALGPSSGKVDIYFKTKVRYSLVQTLQGASPQSYFGGSLATSTSLLFVGE